MPIKVIKPERLQAGFVSDPNSCEHQPRASWGTCHSASQLRPPPRLLHCRFLCPGAGHTQAQHPGSCCSPARRRHPVQEGAGSGGCLDQVPLNFSLSTSWLCSGRACVPARASLYARTPLHAHIRFLGQRLPTQVWSLPSREAASRKPQAQAAWQEHPELPFLWVGCPMDPQVSTCLLHSPCDQVSLLHRRAAWEGRAQLGAFRPAWRGIRGGCSGVPLGLHPVDGP